MSKIIAALISHNDEATIHDTLECLKPFVSKIVVAMSAHPIHGADIPLDRTREICEAAGCEVRWTDQHLKEHQLRNLAIAGVDADLIILADPDMVFEARDLESIISFALASNSRAFKIKQVAYWQDRKHIMVGDPFCPIIAIKPGVNFVLCAGVDQDMELIPGAKVHHYNWCAPKDILKKVKTYHHAPQIAGDWYEKHYLGWREGERAILPDCQFEVMVC